MTVFFILAVLSVIFSALVVTQRNVVHSAMALAATLFIVAVLFLTLDAPMLGILQILVYAGAIMILILFVIMLLNPASLEARPAAWWALGSLGAAALFIQFAALLSHGGLPTAGPAVPNGFGGPEAIAQTLFNDYALPFEIASVLLLVAIIGAVALAQRQR
ncbi:MAG TPA: NADH-quinone oxidoreductase subunit J [Candidatus Binatia bacterium]|jgi:NADH-quinone oxidoreductase subunit J|nr:NADH-quinone oxidoreductase subunit J [Candidatus Binatia bacterium]